MTTYMNVHIKNALKKKEQIRSLKANIYLPLDKNNIDLFFTSHELEYILKTNLKGNSYKGLPIRTRSKVVKSHICEILGYDIPKTFIKTQPRFPAQNFDTYVQKANNLQIWNEELDSTRRYVLIKLNNEDVVTDVKVVNGIDLAVLDTTGKLTTKFQASIKPSLELTELISPRDNEFFNQIEYNFDKIDLSLSTPIDDPEEKNLYSIADLAKKIFPIIGKSFDHLGFDQERNRGGELHRIISKQLGYKVHLDNGKFPDIRHQLLEVKLQTSPTIDLGIALPNSTKYLDMPDIANSKIKHEDIRYVIVYGQVVGEKVIISNVYLTTGRDFFKRFTQFQGKVTNGKLQMLLPENFFD